MKLYEENCWKGCMSFNALLAGRIEKLSSCHTITILLRITLYLPISSMHDGVREDVTQTQEQ